MQSLGTDGETQTHALAVTFNLPLSPPYSTSHLFILNLRLWNNSVFAEAGEETFEHILRVDAVVETSAARLDRAGDVVIFHETENGVSKGPRRNLFVR